MYILHTYVYWYLITFFYFINTFSIMNIIYMHKHITDKKNIQWKIMLSIPTHILYIFKLHHPHVGLSPIYKIIAV